jgi:two-component system KDP operon response regulator KdpE
MAATVPRVLVVDDDPRLVCGLKIILRGAGYVVETAHTIVDAVPILAARAPDVLVLDLVLPDGDGVEVCKEIRLSSELPILVISAVGDEREKLRALDAGADDYLPKPFAGEELLARLRGILRRRGDGGAGSTLEIGELVIDLARRRVTVAGAEVRLAPAEFALVRVLAQRPGCLVTDRQLLRAVWGPEYLQETHHLRSCMARLRTKLERDPSRSRYFVTEWGVGYRLRDPREALA